MNVNANDGTFEGKYLNHKLKSRTLLIWDILAGTNAFLVSGIVCIGITFRGMLVTYTDVTSRDDCPIQKIMYTVLLYKAQE